MNKSELTQKERTLVSNIQRLYFGTMVFNVKNGIPDIETMKMVKEVRFSENQLSQPREVKSDHALKDRFIVFIRYIRSLSDCKVEIEIKNGYPFRLLEQVI